MKMENTNYVFNEERILLTQLGEEGVVYDIQLNEYFTLNETLFIITDGIKNQHGITEIAAKFLSEYAISEEMCLQEINMGIQQLLEKNIIIEKVNA